MDSVVVEETVETPEEQAQYSNIEEASPVEEEEQPQIPSKFKGKSMEEVVSSYENLEKELGRKGQEIGELRKLTDDFLKQQLTTNQNGSEVAQEEDDIDFFDNPDQAVNKVIENHPKFREIEEQQKAQQAGVTTQQLQTAHPDYLEITSNPKFQEWIQESPIRTQLFVNAHNYDLNSALELIGNWKERSLINKTGEAEAQKAVDRDQAMKVGRGVSRTSSEATSGKKIYRRADLIRLRTTDPERYDTLQDEILEAYAEGRVK
jgi:hypothetical protein